MRKIILAATAVLLLAGCVSTNATMLGQSTATAAIDPAAVAIYRTADKVKAPYAEIALLNSTGDYAMTNEKKMYDSMRKEAAKLGANAVILDAMSEPSAGTKVAAAIFGVSASRKGRAIAIRVEGGPNAESAPPKK